MNRNVLKIIACISMLIDHIGWILLPNLIVLRLIGRIAMPIFAFFIAEGLHYTKNYKKYLFRLLIFAIIAQIPYYFVIKSFFKLNILFTFMLAIIAIKIIESFKTNLVLSPISLSILFVVIVICECFDVLDYGLFGILLVAILYFLRDKNIKYILSEALILIYSAIKIINLGSILFLLEPFAALSLLLIYFYNNKKGKLNLKYLFYIFYPAHLAILVLINYFIF